jgi:tetratricopeptide (TPR) repeat protein/thiol-disulfide isomerase/thioredoxin
MKHLRFGLVALFAFVWCHGSVAANPEVTATPRGGASLAIQIDPAWLEQPIQIREGIGVVDRAASTPSPEARSFYEQGLALLHSYEWIDAARSFHESLRADPMLALAELGLAQTYLQMAKPTEAREHLDAAAKLAGERSTSDRERALIDAGKLQLDAVLASAAERPAKLGVYRRALDALIESDPNDAEALLMRGLAEEPSGWGRGQQGGESTLPFYRAALAKSPNHPGAHHYLTHTLENLGQYEEAAAHAKSYANIAKSVPHAQHMVGHLAPRLGHWDEALTHLESANSLGHGHHQDEGIPTAADWHQLHNLVLLGLVYDEMKRPEDARRTLAESFETGNPSATMQLSWSIYPEYLLARGEAAAALRAAGELRTRGPAMDVIGAALEGEALLNLGDEAGAAAKAEEAQRLQVELARATASDPMSTIAGLASNYVQILQGRRMLRAGTANPDQVRSAAQALAARKTFDSWGWGTLRLERLAADARASGANALADEIEADRVALRGPEPILATPSPDGAAAAAPSPAAPSPAVAVAPAATSGAAPHAASSAAPAALPSPSPAAAAGHDWNDAEIAWRSYEAGLEEARAQKKPILLVFFTEWCPHCQNYQRVFHDPRVVEAARDFVMIRIDRDRSPAVSARYAPDGDYIPRTLFLSPDGKLDTSIHAPRDQYLYFYAENEPASLLAGVAQAREKLISPAGAPPPGAP